MVWGQCESAEDVFRNYEGLWDYGWKCQELPRDRVGNSLKNRIMRGIYVRSCEEPFGEMCEEL